MEVVPLVVWTRHRDGGEEWFVSAAGDSVWELPAGATAVDAEPDAERAAPVVNEPEAEVEAALPEPAAAQPAERRRLMGRVVKKAAAAADA